MKINFRIQLLLIAVVTLINCSKEDIINEDVSCSYKGVSFVDPINQGAILISESKLFVGYIGVSVNNKSQIEIYEKNNRDKFMFLTNVVNQDKSGIGDFHLNGINYNANVTCLKAGVNVGDEIIYTFTLNGKEGAFCVKIQDKI